MSRSEREKLEAERQARRANRLSERAEQRARRKADQAQRAADRAEQLAQKVRGSAGSNPRRQRERSIEDVVDDVADKWTRKAESWIDEQSKKMFDDGSSYDGSGYDGSEYDSSDYDGSDYVGSGYDGSADSGYTPNDSQRRSQGRRQQRRKERMKRRKARIRSEFGLEKERKQFKRRNRNGNLYKNSQNKKIFGVCSGIADYWGMETWQVRMMAVVALFVVPSIAVPGYFISSFLMDDKPYYRKVTDRFHELDEAETMSNHSESKHGQRETAKAKTGRSSSKSRRASDNSGRSNVEVLRTAKNRFSDIENRLRVMESHVTSPKFELQRELRKIAGDEV